MVLVLAGIVTGTFTHSQIAVTLNSEIAQNAAEVILAALLFVDATELPGGRLFGNDPGAAARTLLVALPLSLAAVVLIGTLMLPGLPAVILLIIACIIVPPTSPRPRPSYGTPASRRASGSARRRSAEHVRRPASRCPSASG
ncbi:hypothetical protein ACFY7H_29775 [Streptomyces sp. NPDC012794]|uniref:hypothetical protein n=1 Tax=Streptomyces sp. NPDC012794 TaxID=3364850 RepID=UPI00367F23BC